MYDIMCIHNTQIGQPLLSTLLNWNHGGNTPLGMSAGFLPEWFTWVRIENSPQSELHYYMGWGHGIIKELESKLSTCR